MKFALTLLACTCTLAVVYGRPSHEKPQESQSQSQQSSGQSQQSQQSQSQCQQSQTTSQHQCQNQKTKSPNCNSGQQSQSQSSSQKTCSSQTSAPKFNYQSLTQTQKTGPNGKTITYEKVFDLASNPSGGPPIAKTYEFNSADATSSISNGKSTGGGISSLPINAAALPFVSQGAGIFGAGLSSLPTSLVGSSALNAVPGISSLAGISSVPLFGARAGSLPTNLGAGFVPAGLAAFIPSDAVAGFVPTSVVSTNSLPTDSVTGFLPTNAGNNGATGSLPNVVPTGPDSVPDTNLVTGSVPTAGAGLPGTIP